MASTSSDTSNTTPSSPGSPYREIKIDDESIVINLEDKDDLRSSGEEAWTEEAETLAVEWATISKAKAAKHKTKACRNKTLNNFLGLPSVLLPVVFAAATPLIEATNKSTIIQVGGYIAISVLTGINTFYNFDKKSTEHEHYQARFTDLYNDVRYQLFKSRRFRVPSDEFMARVQVKLASLDENEP